MTKRSSVGRPPNDPGLGGREWNGKAMARRRKELGISQLELSWTIGVIETTISRWERGPRVPSKRHVRAIAKALNCSIGYLAK